MSLSQNNLDNSSAKKPYKSPELSTLGLVNDLTQTSPLSPNITGGDGGSHSNRYAS